MMEKLAEAKLLSDHAVEGMVPSWCKGLCYRQSCEHLRHLP